MTKTLNQKPTYQELKGAWLEKVICSQFSTNLPSVTAINTGTRGKVSFIHKRNVRQRCTVRPKT